jgi:hypothetical protein
VSRPADQQAIGRLRFVGWLAHTTFMVNAFVVAVTKWLGHVTVKQYLNASTTA